MTVIAGNVLVTGASGGLGRAVVERLLREPDVERVFAASRSAARWPDRRVVPLPLDVTDATSLARLARGFGEGGARLDLVVQCTGVLHDDARAIAPEKRLEQVEAAALTHSFLVNAAGPILVLKAIAPALAPGVVVVNVSAKVGSIDDNGRGGWYAYRASKAALNQLTRTAALELKRRAPGSVVVAYHPGTLATRLSAPFHSGLAAGQLHSVDEGAGHLLATITRLTPADTGSFLSWDGTRIPW